MAPIVIDGQVVIIGEKVWVRFKREPMFPKDPDGWLQCTFSGGSGPGSIIVKPKGHEKMVIGRAWIEPNRMRLTEPSTINVGGATNG